MKIESRDGTAITTFDGWRDAAPPAGKNGWADGHSAAELARAWTEGTAEEDVTALLASHNDLAGVELSSGIAEKQTRFDDIPRGPRNHDLLIRGTLPRGPLVVAVEGKGDETLSASRDAPHSETSQAPMRLDELTRLCFASTLSDDPSLGALRYQLCSAVAGTLADAKVPEAVAAVLLVHEFATSETKESKQQKNAADLDAFLDRLGGDTPLPKTDGPGGWVTGPVLMNGTNDRLPKTMLLYVAKLTTTAG